ncbi:hypothetical protein AYI69_g1385 [Smittium culicis]|uniref:Uncharacterized protein n=1 Tax=Smittium culicis TaxID=133412 RepID=A0A1R1YQH7_9FUNG|nr:hypothetical protein AYI69_g1385 [Smittium culicis]
MCRCRTQDGDLGTNLSHDLYKRLSDVPSSSRCVHAYTVYHKSGDGNKHSVNVFEGSEVQYPGSSMRGQQTTECFPDEIDMSDELYRESSTSVNRSPTWTSYASKILGTQQLLFFDI